ncbi:hypothetical protein J6590_102577 [Homalodisca vitripennis]|nr:hypothetical protein J6590_102577 [Homalodisca vitripennis]
MAKGHYQVTWVSEVVFTLGTEVMLALNPSMVWSLQSKYSCSLSLLKEINRMVVEALHPSNRSRLEFACIRLYVVFAHSKKSLVPLLVGVKGKALVREGKGTDPNPSQPMDQDTLPPLCQASVSTIFTTSL